MLRRRFTSSTYLPAALTLLVGLVATAIVFASVRHLESEKLSLDFDQRAAVRIAAVTRGFDDAVQLVRVINQLFVADEDHIGRAQFRSFTLPLLERYPFIQAVNLHRLIRGSERASYEAAMRLDFPGFRLTEMQEGKLVPTAVKDLHNVVDFIEPLQGNEPAFGLDVSNNVELRSALQRAVDTDLPAATGMVRLAQARRGFLVLMPLYRKGAAHATPAQRRDAVIGDTGVVLKADGLVEKILAGNGLLASSGIGITVYAGDGADAAQMAFSDRGTRMGAAAFDLTRWLPIDDARTLRRRIDVAGKPWTIVVNARRGWSGVSYPGSILTLVGGILISLGAAAYIQALNIGSRRIRTLVDQRTHQLSVANQLLTEDNTARRLAESALKFQNNRDPLTGLANRNLLRDRLGLAIAHAARSAHPIWVLFVDLDRFKFINDSLGHLAGDELLKKVAERLQGALRETDTVARLGGDEFVLLLPEGNENPLSTVIVQRVMDAIARPLTIEGHEFFLTCSIGVSSYPVDGEDVETLIKHADIAMYRAKQTGRNNFQFYTAKMNEQALERLRLEGDLRLALERDEFILHYQPQVDLRSGRIVGMEALIRWQHPALGMVPPGRFIGLAEETGLIVPIGAWVLRTACAQIKAWQSAGLGFLRVSVNLSARQFYQRDLLESVGAVLAQSGLDPQYLEIELTESMVMTDVDSAVAILRGLKALGVQMSIDDFGTGYSSLSYLKRFPIDVLKIDQSFVRDITIDPDDAAIVTSIISLAHNLRLNVIAEGVETEAQLEYLRRHGCDEIQGYYFSRPVDAEAFAALVVEGRSLPG
jgi:diguanylate cyclase (GGDEF)-like protein